VQTIVNENGGEATEWEIGSVQNKEARELRARLETIQE